MGRGFLIAAAAVAAATFGTAAQAGEFGEAGGFGSGMCGFGKTHLQSVMKTLPPGEEPANHTVAAAEEPAPVEDVEALLSSLLGTPFKLPTAEQDG